MNTNVAFYHIVSGWLKKFVLGELANAHLNPEKFASELDGLFTERKLTSIVQQKNPRSIVVQSHELLSLALSKMQKTHNLS